MNLYLTKLCELPPVHNLLLRVTYGGVGPCRCVSIRFTSMKYRMNRLADIRHACGYTTWYGADAGFTRLPLSVPLYGERPVRIDGAAAFVCLLTYAVCCPGD